MRASKKKNGCAYLDIANLLKRKPGPKIHFIHFMQPNLFCNIDKHDVFSQNKNVGGTGTRPDVKLIHMIRDPFDMVISNYLYHSQTPTPEKFAFTYDPCVLGNGYLQSIINSTETTTLITQQQVDGLKAVCDDLMLNKKTNKRYKGFYAALLGLPMYDGLRLSAIVLLISKAQFLGGDLLRMTANVERLHQWQTKQQQQYPESTSGIISLKTHPDWDKENYEASLDRLTKFTIADLEVLGNNNDDREMGSSASTGNETTLQKHKGDLVQAVRINAIKRLNQNTLKKSNHVTAHRMTPEEREDAVAKLRADDLLGPILSTCQKIIDSADGLGH
jgi:hypothetical protein